MKILTTREDDKGIMIIKQNDTHTLYEIMTFAGKYRGGKIYSEDKEVIIVSGKAVVTICINKKDSEIILTPESGKYIIPAGIPNLFYFLENTEITEKFLKETKIEKFERYRLLKT